MQQGGIHTEVLHKTGRIKDFSCGCKYAILASGVRLCRKRCGGIVVVVASSVAGTAAAIADDDDEEE